MSRTLRNILIAFIAIAATGVLHAEPSHSTRLAVEQQRVADKYKRLEEILLRMAELTSGTDPRRSALLKKAVAQSKEQLIGVQFERLAEQLEKGKLSRALKNNKELDKDLRSLLTLLLSENRAKRIETEKARIRKYLKQLNRLIKQQKGIQGRTAGKGKPQRLADDQKRLTKKTDGLAKDIKQSEKNNKQGKAGKQLEAAKKRMQEAQNKLRKAERDGAVEEQEKAIQELEKAKSELEEILRQLREEEIERMLTVLEVRFKKMLHMQRAVHKSTLRLDKVPTDERGRSHEIEASRLSSKESLIVVEAEKALVLLHDDGSAVAFPEAVEQIKQDMQQVVKRLARAKTGKITIAIEEDILAALEEMIEALQKAIQDQEKRRDKKQPSKGRPTDPPLVDMLAELKMVRALQMRINRRTKRYSLLIEGEQANNPELLQALERLAKREQRIHRITRDLEMGKNR